MNHDWMLTHQFINLLIYKNPVWFLDFTDCRKQSTEQSNEHAAESCHVRQQRRAHPLKSNAQGRQLILPSHDSLLLLSKCRSSQPFI